MVPDRLIIVCWACPDRIEKLRRGQKQHPADNEGKQKKQGALESDDIFDWVRVGLSVGRITYKNYAGNRLNIKKKIMHRPQCIK